MKTPTSEIIPRERLSAWQRWELAALPGGTSAVHDSVHGAADAEAIARERAAAAEEGRAAGYAEGRALAAQEQARLGQIAASLSRCASEHDQRLVDEVLDLAVVLARQMVGEALAVRREFVLPVVRAALRQLPQASQRVEILLNPIDVPLVQQSIAAEALGDRCRLTASAAVAPGGCRIETEQCEVDATVASRWKRLLASLGRSDDWLEPV